ncbi:hypothetical protein ES703_68733 [subsurface metagenome]
MPLMFVLFRCRLIASLFSGSLLTRPSRGPRESPAFPETRLLLFPTIPVIPVPSLLLRAGLPVIVGTEVFLSLTELPIREDLLELIRLLELLTRGRVLRTLGFLVLIILPIREDLLELIRLLELLTCGRVLRTLGFLVLIILPIREDLPELIRLLELLTCGRVLRTLGVLVLIEPPIREVVLELIRLPEIADVCLPVPELTVVGLLLLRDLLDGLLPPAASGGLRVLEVIPDRIVPGRLTVTLPG